jgi:hypothetical protein
LYIGISISYGNGRRDFQRLFLVKRKERRCSRSWLKKNRPGCYGDLIEREGTWVSPSCPFFLASNLRAIETNQVILIPKLRKPRIITKAYNRKRRKEK